MFKAKSDVQGKIGPNSGAIPLKSMGQTSQQKGGLGHIDQAVLVPILFPDGLRSDDEADGYAGLTKFRTDEGPLRRTFFGFDRYMRNTPDI